MDNEFSELNLENLFTMSDDRNRKENGERNEWQTLLLHNFTDSS